MKKLLLFIHVLIIIVAISFHVSQACSTFALQKGERIVYGRNYDWFISDGMVVINKKNVSKTGLLSSSQGALTWVSKYGSISFNQYGKDLPLDGMNEAGLVVANMWLETTKWEPPDSRLSITPLVWIQYQLDNSASVKEVIKSRKKIRVDGTNSGPLHYLVCDRYGDAVVIEFLEGKAVYHRGKNLPLVTLTNSTYAVSLQFYEADEKEKAEMSRLVSGNSLERFGIAAHMLTEYKQQSDIPIETYAFQILSSVAQGSTQWSIVYDINNLQVHFKTQQNPVIKTVRLQDFNLNCDTPPKILDLHTQETGDVSRCFVPFSTEDNRKLIFSVFKKTPFLTEMPDTILEALSKWPESHRCTTKSTH